MRVMWQALGSGELHLPEGPPEVHELDGTLREPRLALDKTGWLDQFASSVTVLFREPAAPKEFLGGPYFRDCWIDQRFPKFAFAAAVALQILLILFPPPIWTTRPPHVVAPPPDMEMTWYGPVKDLPAISPARKRPKAMSREHELKTPPRLGADAFHPRQTIISDPLRPTHPRQTLIQPAAPQQPPKILPALPNIVQLADSQPSRPKLQLTAEQLAAMRPKDPRARRDFDFCHPRCFHAWRKDIGTSSTSLRPKGWRSRHCRLRRCPHREPRRKKATRILQRQRSGDIRGIKIR